MSGKNNINITNITIKNLKYMRKCKRTKVLLFMGLVSLFISAAGERALGSGNSSVSIANNIPPAAMGYNEDTINNGLVNKAERENKLVIIGEVFSSRQIGIFLEIERDYGHVVYNAFITGQIGKTEQILKNLNILGFNVATSGTLEKLYVFFKNFNSWDSEKQVIIQGATRVNSYISSSSSDDEDNSKDDEKIRNKSSLVPACNLKKITFSALQSIKKLNISRIESTNFSAYDAAKDDAKVGSFPKSGCMNFGNYGKQDRVMEGKEEEEDGIEIRI